MNQSSASPASKSKSISPTGISRWALPDHGSDSTDLDSGHGRTADQPGASRPAPHRFPHGLARLLPQRLVISSRARRARRCRACDHRPAALEIAHRPPLDRPAGRERLVRRRRARAASPGFTRLRAVPFRRLAVPVGDTGPLLDPRSARPHGDGAPRGSGARAAAVRRLARHRAAGPGTAHRPVASFCSSLRPPARRIGRRPRAAPSREAGIDRLLPARGAAGHLVAVRPCPEGRSQHLVIARWLAPLVVRGARGVL